MMNSTDKEIRKLVKIKAIELVKANCTRITDGSQEIDFKQIDKDLRNDDAMALETKLRIAYTIGAIQLAMALIINPEETYDSAIDGIMNILHDDMNTIRDAILKE